MFEIDVQLPIWIQVVQTQLLQLSNFAIISLISFQMPNLGQLLREVKQIKLLQILLDHTNKYKFMDQSNLKKISKEFMLIKLNLQILNI